MIPITKPFNYISLKRVDEKGGSRYYLDPEGNALSSVTTILSKTKYSPELEAWKERVGLVEAERVRTEATGLGSLMHTHLENHIQGIPRPGGTNTVRKMASSMADVIIGRGLCNVSEVWSIEQILYFPELYAGTADILGIHNGKPAVMDYKTSNKMKTEEMIEDYFVQGVAYVEAHNEVYNTNINKIVIFMVARDYSYKEFIIEGKKIDTYRDLWIKRVEEYYSKYSS